MKKFLLIFGLITFSMIFPFTNVKAADVPDFYQIGGQGLSFTGKEIGKNQPRRIYGYDCDVDLNRVLAERYIGLLLRNYDFQMVDHYVNDYRKGQAKLYERWIFIYTGSKSVSTFVHKNPANLKNPYYCHLIVGVSKDWQAGVTHFSVWVADGLTYGGD